MWLIKRCPLLVCMVLLFVNRTTSGDVWIDSGGLHIEDEGQYTINREISDWVHVDYFTKPALGTRVDILEQGLLRQGLQSYGNSKIFISGGTVQEVVSVGDNSQLDLEKGMIGLDLLVLDHSVVKIMGGTIGGKLVSTDFAQIDFTGGKVEGNLIAYSYGEVTIYGTGFNYPLGNLSASSGHLTGILLDGTPIDNDFEINSHDASIVLVPEPYTLALLVFGGVIIIRKRIKQCRQTRSIEPTRL